MRFVSPIDGAKYCFRNTNAGTGEIYDSSGTIIWSYRPPGSAWNFLNGPLRRPQFVLSDPSGLELLRIKREKSLPLPSFTITAIGSPAGAISKRRFLSTDYAARFTDGTNWVFQIPLFSVRFRGVSAAGAKVHVRLASELVWYVLIEEGHDGMPLVASLAFIHSERCRW